MNIALVKLSSIGDVVHALPVASALRASLPQARLSWIVERREAGGVRSDNVHRHHRRGRAVFEGED